MTKIKVVCRHGVEYSLLARGTQGEVNRLKEMPSLAELGSWQKCANSVLRTIGDIDTMTRNQIVNAIVGKVYEYSKKGEL